MSENQIDNIVSNVKATIAIENHNLDTFDIELMRKYLCKEITMNEAMEAIKSDVFGG